MIAGIIILIYPISSALTLAFIGGIWLVVLGFIQVFAGFQLRGRRRPPARPDPGTPCYPVARRPRRPRRSRSRLRPGSSRPRSGVAQW